MVVVKNTIKKKEKQVTKLENMFQVDKFSHKISTNEGIYKYIGIVDDNHFFLFHFKIFTSHIVDQNRQKIDHLLPTSKQNMY